MNRACVCATLALLSATVMAQTTGDAPPSAAASTQATPQTATQPSTAPAVFLAADFSLSPQRRFPYFNGVTLVGDRYILRQATMLDLVSAAFGVDDRFVSGGPNWLEMDRFDVIAKVPLGTTPKTAQPMLRALLKERFSLVTHEGTAPMPAYILRVEKDKMKPSDGTGDGGCHGVPRDQTPGAVPMAGLHCINKAMDSFVTTLANSANWQFDAPLVDATGLKGGYDFDLKWTPHDLLAQAGSGAVTIFDALKNQLGLTLTLETAPRPVLIVDSVNELPTANALDLAKALPPLPPSEFEVATIKPYKPGEPGGGRITGSELNFHGISLKELIVYAWDLSYMDKEQIVNAPKWLETDLFDIDAKLSSEDTGKRLTKGSPVDPEVLRQMVRALLIERFEMKVHMEDRPVDAYDLVADNPRLTKADPASRTRCKEGPGPDGNDPRLKFPVQNMLMTCQNMSMEQIGRQFSQWAAGYIYNPVRDETGIKGTWNFTLNWSSVNQMPGMGGGRGGGASGGDVPMAADPNGALSFFDAVHKQLGLKLMKVKRPEPVLVIDSIDEQPTAN